LGIAFLLAFSRNEIAVGQAGTSDQRYPFQYYIFKDSVKPKTDVNGVSVKFFFSKSAQTPGDKSLLSVSTFDANRKKITDSSASLGFTVRLYDEAGQVVGTAESCTTPMANGQMPDNIQRTVSGVTIDVAPRIKTFSYSERANCK